MIVFFRNGRLGNQIFQYVGVSGVRRSGESILLVGFDELIQTFDGVDARSISLGSGLLLRLFERYKAKFVTFLQYGMRFGLIRQDLDAGLRAVRKDLSIHSVVDLRDDFPSESAGDPQAIRGLQFKSHLQQGARRRIQEHANRYQPVFVHVRRGDYLTWPSAAQSAALPDWWYLRALEHVKQRIPRARFLVMSDDIDACRSMFADVADVTILEGSPSLDLATMSKCVAGVLSPSSLAWWGARFASHSGAAGPFIAPKYWAGHATAKWFPTAEMGKTSFVSYVDWI